MRKVLLMLASGLFVIAGAAVPATSQAADKPNILIMGEDADQDTVPRNSRVFRRVLDGVANQLHDEGFDVFDETAVSLDNFAQGRARRTDAEIIDVAKSIKRPPIDVAVIFTIYASANETSYTTKIKTRIAGRLLQVKTGQRLGNFEVTSPRTWNAPADCPRECILEVVGKYSRVLANDLGSVLAEKLADLLDRRSSAGVVSGGKIANAFTLVFEGFTPEDIMDMEEYLAVFRGYKTHRLVYSGRRHHEVWYESNISAGRLDRNLKKMLDRLDISARVSFAGSEYTVQKITRRKTRVLDPDEW